jgi:hypothetical protein
MDRGSRTRVEGADLMITASGGVLSLEKDGTGPQFPKRKSGPLKQQRIMDESRRTPHGVEAIKRAILAGVASLNTEHL